MRSDIFIDESSQTKHRYLVLGGIIVPTICTVDLEAAVMAARQPELPAGEMAWTKVSRSKLAAYCRVVDVFFSNAANFDHLDFHCVVIDTSRINDRRFNKGSRELGFNKEIYQLAMKFGRLYSDRLFHVYLDRRNTSQPPRETRVILNRGIMRRDASRDWPFRRLHFRDSDKTISLQVVDVLLGAVAFKLNRHYEASDASPAKKTLCDYVLQQAHVHDVHQDTERAGRFTIWHRQLR